MIDTCIHEDNLEEEEEIVIAECFMDNDMEFCYLKSYNKNENNLRDKAGEEEEEDLTLVADLIAVGIIAGSDVDDVTDIDYGDLDPRTANIDSDNININNDNNNVVNNDNNNYDKKKNSSSIPSAVAMVVSEKRKGGGKGIGKEIGKDLSHIQKMNEITPSDKGLKTSDEKVKKLGAVLDVVAVAVAVEFTEDSTVSELNHSTQSDLLLESDPEPVILEAETVISVPRTLSKSKNHIVGEEKADIKNENQNNISEKITDDSLIESNKKIRQRDVKKEVEKEVVEESVMHESFENKNKSPPVEFLMSWNRRIAESSIFFDLMLQAGFSCEHKGKCVYSFTVLNK